MSERKGRIAASTVAVIAATIALIIAAMPDPGIALRAASYGLIMLAGMLLGAVVVMALRPPNPDTTEARETQETTPVLTE